MRGPTSADTTGALSVLDEIHRTPGLFETLRGVIDERIRAGETAGQFLLLGSASMDLLRQSGESLAGRIAYLELGPLDVRELEPREQTRLWIRGGFPTALLAPTDADSALWRENFIHTYLGAGRGRSRTPDSGADPAAFLDHARPCPGGTLERREVGPEAWRWTARRWRSTLT